MYGQQSLPIREEVETCHQAGMNIFIETGTWLKANERFAVLQEVRNAASCKLCAERKQALSPYAVEGEHDSLGELPENFVEVIHRIKTDSGRLTKRWFDTVISEGLSEETYIELVGLVATSVILDTYATGIGDELKAAEKSKIEDREPIRKKNPGVVEDGAWVPLLDVPPGGDVAGLPAAPNIARAMGLVPLAIEQFFGVMRCHYNLTDLSFDIDRTQVELIAARVSSYNDCFY